MFLMRKRCISFSVCQIGAASVHHNKYNVCNGMLSPTNITAEVIIQTSLLIPTKLQYVCFSVKQEFPERKLFERDV